MTLMILAFVLAQAPAGDVSQLLHAEFHKTIDAERASLRELADRIDKEGKHDDAEAVRKLIEPEQPEGRLRFRLLPEVWVPPDPSTVPAAAQDIRTKTAKQLFTLAGKAASAKPIRRFALADACLRGVLERDANHAETRRLLGYLRHAKGWATPHAIELIKSGHVLHPKFGWVQNAWVPHLDAGELPAEFDAAGKPREWVAEAKADELRRQWPDVWTIETAPHFVIETNVPLAEGVAFATRLEAFHQLFFSQFADLLGMDLPLAKRFDNKTLKPVVSPKRFQVAYFAQKSEYVDHLRATYGLNEDISLGYYLPADDAKKVRKPPRSFFYKDPANQIAEHATLYHEASHQILFEANLNWKYNPAKSNFWIWEGLGTYFETVEPQDDGTILIGGRVGPRMQQAAINAKNDYLPLAKLVAMNEEKFRDNDDVYRNYAQGMAFAAFLLHGENGAYREKFLDYVADAYKGKTAKPLSERLGVTYEELDKQFKAYLK